MYVNVFWVAHPFAVLHHALGVGHGLNATEQAAL